MTKVVQENLQSYNRSQEASLKHIEEAKKVIGNSKAGSKNIFGEGKKRIESQNTRKDSSDVFAAIREICEKIKAKPIV